MKTITIAGGGLAGLSLGIALRGRGVPVIVHEAGSYPRHRVCGEFVSGVSSATLEALGVEPVFRDARRLRTSAWYRNGKCLLEANLPDPAMGLSRYRLDRRLADRFVAGGGDLRTGSRMKAGPAEGFVWAAGRRPDRESDWLGLKVHATGIEMRSDLEMHLGTEGYVGLAPVDEDKVNVCGLFRKRDLSAKGVELLAAYLEVNGIGEVARRLGDGRPDAASLTGVSAFRLGRQPEVGALCAIGDAESMIPPFTGNGMSMALEAAAAATEPLVGYAGGGNWEEAVTAVRRRLQERFRRRLITARFLHSFLLTSMGRAFLSIASTGKMLPFRPLFHLLR